MKTMNKRLVAVAGLLAFSLACSSNPAAAQTPRDYADRIMNRSKSRAAGGGHTADVFAQLPNRIVAIADSMKNRHVWEGGKAECANFVSEVLRQAGAKPGNFAVENNYIWGTLRLKRLGKAVGPKPNIASRGDVIQFEGCVFRVTKSDGSWYAFDFPHHTAIVKSCNGTEVTILHQNAPPGSPVHEDKLDLAGKTTGTYKIYTPVPR